MPGLLAPGHQIHSSWSGFDCFHQPPLGLRISINFANALILKLSKNGAKPGIDSNFNDLRNTRFFTIGIQFNTDAVHPGSLLQQHYGYRQPSDILGNMMLPTVLRKRCHIRKGLIGIIALGVGYAIFRFEENSHVAEKITRVNSRMPPPCICCGGFYHAQGMDGPLKRGVGVRGMRSIIASRGGSNNVELGDYIHEEKVGDVKVYMLRDGSIEIPLSRMFPSIESSEWKPFQRIQQDQIARLSSGCVLLQVASEDNQTVNMLLDSGLGVVDPPFPPSVDLRDVLFKAAEISREDIHMVVHTHVHQDHTGWNVYRDADGSIKPMFPNAMHCVQAKEYDFWGASSELRKRTNFDVKLKPLQDRNMIRMLNGRETLAPGVEVLPCEGHTPGHMVVRISSLGATGYYIGDALHHLAQITNPNWSPVFDWDAPLAERSRKELMTRIANENALLFSPHFPFPGSGTISETSQGFRYDWVKSTG
ncbi:hypothetical protein AAMO2058_000986200 [Amorphochlora amoebiformis]